MKQVAELIIPVDEELHLQTEDGQVVVSSRYIAERFSKRHSDVVRAIESHITSLISTGAKVRWFQETTYEDAKGENRKAYLMNRDGFSLLVMSFNNTKDVLNWKLKYIEAFNKMEEYIREHKPFLDYKTELEEFDKVARVIGLSKNDKLISVLSIMHRHGAPTLGLEELVDYKIPSEMQKRECSQEALEYVVSHNALGFTLAEYYKHYLVYCAKSGIKPLDKVPFCKAVRQLGYEAKSKRIDGETCKVWVEKY